MKESRSGQLPLVVGALLLPIGLYVGGYAALVDRSERLHICDDGICRRQRYSHGGKAAEYLFAPARWVDQQLQPEEDWR